MAPRTSNRFLSGMMPASSSLRDRSQSRQDRCERRKVDGRDCAGQIQIAAERMGFYLKLADVHNMKAAEALLDGHDSDLCALRVAEPGTQTRQTANDSSVIGLESTGVAK